MASLDPTIEMLDTPEPTFCTGRNSLKHTLSIRRGKEREVGLGVRTRPVKRQRKPQSRLNVDVETPLMSAGKDLTNNVHNGLLGRPPTKSKVKRSPGTKRLDMFKDGKALGRKIPGDEDLMKFTSRAMQPSVVPEASQTKVVTTSRRRPQTSASNMQRKHPNNNYSAIQDDDTVSSGDTDPLQLDLTPGGHRVR
jgi:hypothetical protein